jgi:hypothetical protein
MTVHTLLNQTPRWERRPTVLINSTVKAVFINKNLDKITVSSTERLSDKNGEKFS